MKFAIVDLGSNTIRLSVYNTLPEGGFDLLFSEKEMAGLVSYVHGGVLSPEGIQRACGAIRDFQALLRQFDLDAPHVFATASLRNIRNTEEAVEQIRAATGVGVDVISGELEARLGYYGARTATDLQDGAMFDIGGGSAEVLEVRAGEALKIANDWYEKPAGNRILTPAEVRRLTKLLLKRDHQARKLILRHCPDRVHTILPGIVLMDALTEALCEGELYISPYGVREGYLCHKLLNAGT